MSLCPVLRNKMERPSAVTVNPLSQFASFRATTVVESFVTMYAMKTTLSSKGQVVLPVHVRRQLRLHQGDPLAVEVRDGSIVLRPVLKPRRYKTGRHPVSGLPVMVAVEPSGRRVTVAGIARLHAELL